MRTRHWPCFVVALFAAGAPPQSLAQDVPAGAVVFTPDKAKWAPGLRVPELQTAPILGDQTKAERYLVMTRFPPNFKIQPHTHPDERHYTVISGTWYVGFGATWDDSKLIALPAGSYYSEPANAPHFVATKADGAVIHVGAMGPTGTTFMDPAKK